MNKEKYKRGVVTSTGSVYYNCEITVNTGVKRYYNNDHGYRYKCVVVHNGKQIFLPQSSFKLITEVVEKPVSKPVASAPSMDDIIAAFGSSRVFSVIDVVNCDIYVSEVTFKDAKKCAKEILARDDGSIPEIVMTLMKTSTKLTVAI